MFSELSSNASSLRLHVIPYVEREAREHTAAFLPLPSPKLSRLDIQGLQPASSSPIFTTSDLVSLKLSTPDGYRSPYTRSQFSEILQRHSGLQELRLRQNRRDEKEIRPTHSLSSRTRPLRCVLTSHLFGVE